MTLDYLGKVTATRCFYCYYFLPLISQYPGERYLETAQMPWFSSNFHPVLAFICRSCLQLWLLWNSDGNLLFSSSFCICQLSSPPNKIYLICHQQQSLFNCSHNLWSRCPDNPVELSWKLNKMEHIHSKHSMDVHSIPSTTHCLMSRRAQWLSQTVSTQSITIHDLLVSVNFAYMEPHQIDFKAPRWANRHPPGQGDVLVQCTI